jgi:hypothetical protein
MVSGAAKLFMGAEKATKAVRVISQVKAGNVYSDSDNRSDRHLLCRSRCKEQSKTATELAYAEVISYNKKNLERKLQNESRQHNRQQSKAKRREKKI